MLLQNKNAIIYGGGLITAAVAQAFAREGARVFLAGRNSEKLTKIVEDIRTADGTAEMALVDALDQESVNNHAASVVSKAGSIDISFNLISLNDVQGTPLIEMSLADFESPVFTAVRSTFLTSTAAGRQMVKQGSGVILLFGGYGDPIPNYNLGGLQVAFGALESFRKNLASELGPHGIRVITLQTGGIMDTLPPDMPEREEIIKMTNEKTMLGRSANLADVGNVAVFAASDMARTITGTYLNITCGSRVD